MSGDRYHDGGDGVRYRVLDRRFGPDAGLPPFRRRHSDPPDPRANYRVFHDGRGTVRVHMRRPDEDWGDLSWEALERQLRASGYAGRSRFNAKLHGDDVGRPGT